MKKINYLCGIAPVCSSLSVRWTEKDPQHKEDDIRTKFMQKKAELIFSKKRFIFLFFQNPENQNVNLDLNPNPVLHPILEKRQDKKGSNSLLNIKTLK
jgi:hypothetical protein